MVTRVLITLGLCISFASAHSQIKWTAEIKQSSDSLFNITVNAELQKGWHLYAKPDAASGIEPLGITYTNENVQANGQLNFNSELNPYKDLLFDNHTLLVATGNVQLNQTIQIKGPVPGSIKIIITGFASNDKEFSPVNETLYIPVSVGSTANNQSQILLPGVNMNQPESTCGESGKGTDTSLLNIFCLGFIGGLLALLTPCVFPMIPVTVSFFTNKAANRKMALRNGLLYGVFIFSIYGLAGLPFRFIHAIDPQILNTISTNAIVNLLFFAIFIFFSLSFFGLFEITLPSSLSNSAGNKTGIGSASGIFFMALTLAIVSFSCTGPILGTLLVSSLSDNAGAWQLTTGMLGFGAGRENLERDLKNPFYIGNIVLFGSGIRSETHHGYKPAVFLFRLNKALEILLKSKETTIPVTFAAHSVLINGQPSVPKVASPVQIGEFNLLLETAGKK